MVKDIATALHGARDTLLADVAGAVALVVLLFGGLTLPGLV